VLRSENVECDAVHMMERCQLFLIIAPGEAVLTTATPGLRGGRVASRHAGK
jgi:low temperature requirement protein LtrA